MEVNQNVATHEHGDILYSVYVGDYIANEQNVSIRFRWHTSSSNLMGYGYGWQIDDIKITDNEIYDLRITDTRVNFFEYIDYTQENNQNYYHYSSHYGQIPANQFGSDNAKIWSNVALENKGVETVTPEVNIRVIDPNSVQIFEHSITGNLMVNQQIDTIDFTNIALELGENPDIGEYKIIFEVLIDGFEDENPTDNLDTATFIVTEYKYARDVENITGKISPKIFQDGGNSGDMIATDYIFFSETAISNVEIYIHEDSDPGTSFLMRILQYDENLGSWLDISHSALIIVEESFLGSWTQISMIDEVLIQPDEENNEFKKVRLVIEFHDIEEYDLYIGIDETNNHSIWDIKWFLTQGMNSHYWFSHTNLPAWGGLGMRLICDSPIPCCAEISEIIGVNDINICQGATEEELLIELPAQTSIIDSNSVLHGVNLTWDLSEFDADTPNDYIVSASFELPSGVIQTQPETDLIVNTTVSVKPNPEIFDVTTTPSDGILNPEEYGTIKIANSENNVSYWVTKGTQDFSPVIQGIGGLLNLGDNYYQGNYNVWSETEYECKVLQESVSFIEDDGNNKIIVNVSADGPSEYIDVTSFNINLYKEDTDNNNNTIFTLVDNSSAPGDIGQTEFTNLENGTYYLTSHLQYEIFYYYLNPHVYYDDATTHENALPISIQDDIIYVANIHHSFIDEYLGSNNLGGSVNTENDKKELYPTANKVVILKNNITNETIDIRVTNENRVYLFENIPDNSDLKLFVSDFLHNNWIPYYLETQTDENYEVNFIIDGSYVYPEGYTNVSDNFIKNIEFSIFPNPAHEVIYFNDLPHGSTLKVFCSNAGLIDILKVSDKNHYNISHLSADIYIIVLENEGKIGIQKFTKK